MARVPSCRRIIVAIESSSFVRCERNFQNNRRWARQALKTTRPQVLFRLYATLQRTMKRAKKCKCLPTQMKPSVVDEANERATFAGRSRGTHSIHVSDEAGGVCSANQREL